MYEYYFTFGSVTQAQIALQTLSRKAIPAHLIRTPKAIQMQGCGHSIAVSSGYYLRAKDEFEQKKVPYRRIFCKFSDGSFEEIVK